MKTEQREVLDAIHVAWTANSNLTFPQLITKVFHEPYIKKRGLSEDWELMTNREVIRSLNWAGSVE